MHFNKNLQRNFSIQQPDFQVAFPPPKLRLIHNVNFQRKLAIFESFTKLKAVETSLGVYRLIDFKNSNGTYPSTMNFQKLRLLVENYLKLHNLNSEA